MCFYHDNSLYQYRHCVEKCHVVSSTVQKKHTRTNILSIYALRYWLKETEKLHCINRACAALYSFAPCHTGLTCPPRIMVFFEPHSVSVQLTPILRDRKSCCCCCCLLLLLLLLLVAAALAAPHSFSCSFIRCSCHLLLNATDDERRLFLGFCCCCRRSASPANAISSRSIAAG